MKVLAFVVTILMATLLLTLGGLVIVLETPHSQPGEILLGAGGFTLFVYGPTLLGALNAYWDTKKSPDSRRVLRVWLLVVGGLDVLAAAAVIAWAMLAGATALIPIVSIAVAAGLFVAAIAVGRALQRRDEHTRSSADAWEPVEPSAIRRKVLAIAITFCATFIVVGAILIALSAGFGDDGLPVAQSIGFAAMFACLFAACAGIIVSIPLARQLRDIANADLGFLRRLSREVLRGKPDQLRDGEQASAERYAITFVLVSKFQVAYFCLLYGGLAGVQVGQLTSGSSDHIIPLVTLVLFIVILAAAVPLWAVRISRAGRYAREHRADLEAPAVAW